MANKLITVFTKDRQWPWQKKSISNAGDFWAEILAKTASKSGIKINWKTALQYTTAQACMRIIAEDIAQLPFATYRSLPDGGRESINNLSISSLIKTKPNDWQTSFELREQLGMHLTITNNAYCWKNIVRGEIAELLPFDPNLVRLERKNNETIYWLTLDDGKQVDVPAREIWHLRGPSWNGWQGLDGIRLMRESVGLALALEEHASRMFQNGATVGGLLSTDAFLTPEQRQPLKESWQARQGGLENAYKTAVLWGGMKWTPMGMPNTDAQHLENRRFQVEETCRAFKMQPIMVGHSDKTTTYASAEQMVLMYMRQTLGPWLTRIEQSANCNLLTDEQREAGIFTRFNRNALMAMTADARANYYSKMYGIGAYNPNEIRELEDMNPYAGGDQYRVPLNMVDPNTITDKPTDTGQNNGNANQ